MNVCVENPVAVTNLEVYFLAHVTHLWEGSITRNAADPDV
jgi:hypothetical protein